MLYSCVSASYIFELDTNGILFRDFAKLDIKPTMPKGHRLDKHSTVVTHEFTAMYLLCRVQ